MHSHAGRRGRPGRLTQSTIYELQKSFYFFSLKLMAAAFRYFFTYSQFSKKFAAA
jgi:hypothetical protein